MPVSRRPINAACSEEGKLDRLLMEAYEAGYAAAAHFLRYSNSVAESMCDSAWDNFRRHDPSGGCHEGDPRTTTNPS